MLKKSVQPSLSLGALDQIEFLVQCQSVFFHEKVQFLWMNK